MIASFWTRENNVFGLLLAIKAYLFCFNMAIKWNTYYLLKDL